MSRDIETTIRTCYSTWADTYFRDYYGDGASYPPVHRDLALRLLEEAGARTVLDSGCGPATILRDVADRGMEAYGFDLTPEMVAEARRVMGERGVPEDRIWQGSVLDPANFRAPDGMPAGFDATLCIGVLPHIPAEADAVAAANLVGAVRPGGLVIAEARNQFFALFTLNRYSYQFFTEELLRVDEMKGKAGGEALDAALEEMRARFRMDLPPVRKGVQDEPGYDEVLSRTHNPLVLRSRFERAGLTDVRLLFYHYHCLPPMLQGHAPELFRRESLAMEDPEDWRGMFMASAFLIVGRRA